MMFSADFDNNESRSYFLRRRNVFNLMPSQKPLAKMFHRISRFRESGMSVQCRPRHRLISWLYPYWDDKRHLKAICFTPRTTITSYRNGHRKLKHKMYASTRTISPFVSKSGLAGKDNGVWWIYQPHAYLVGITLLSFLSATTDFLLKIVQKCTIGMASMNELVRWETLRVVTL
jgi:hypothetical protein